MLDILVQMPSSWEGRDAKIILQMTGRGESSGFYLC